MKIDPVLAAQKIVEERYPHCHAALLAGSVVRGEATVTSDLDLVLFDSTIGASYRESFHAYGWPVEAFVHSWTTYREFFQKDCQRAQPSMPRMVAEGVIVKHDDRMGKVKEEAEDLLEEGPVPWTQSMIDQKRYFLTDSLEDFIGCTDRGEQLFISGLLAEQISEFHLRINGQWIGSSKWVVRALRNYDRRFAEQLVGSLDAFYKKGDKGAVVELVDEVLAPYGGRLFEGFSVGRK